MPTLNVQALVDYAERLEAPACLVEYLYDEFLELEDIATEDFRIYVADRLSEANYLATLYRTGDQDLADEQSAEVFCEVCQLLDVDPEQPY